MSHTHFCFQCMYFQLNKRAISLQAQTKLCKLKQVFHQREQIYPDSFSESTLSCVFSQHVHQ